MLDKLLLTLLFYLCKAPLSEAGRVNPKPAAPPLLQVSLVCGENDSPANKRGTTISCHDGQNKSIRDSQQGRKVLDAKVS